VNDPEDHHRASAACLTVAKALRAEHPTWSVVPLFYSAMHLMHARFIEDSLPAEMQCPRVHKSQWAHGARVKWGTEDVIRAEYPKEVSTGYSSLSAASRAVRYDYLVMPDCDRFWQEYEQIV
jgi:hypothetical protein